MSSVVMGVDQWLIYCEQHKVYIREAGKQTLSSHLKHKNAEILNFLLASRNVVIIFNRPDTDTLDCKPLEKFDMLSMWNEWMIADPLERNRIQNEWPRYFESVIQRYVFSMKVKVKILLSREEFIVYISLER